MTSSLFSGPAIVQIAIPPSQGSLLGQVRAELLAGALTRRLGRTVVVTMARSYEHLSELLEAGACHALWVPPALRDQAEQRAFAVLVPVRGAAQQYCAALIGRRDDPHNGTFAGARAAWVSPTSAAGYRLPREYLQSQGLVPDQLFSSQQHFGSYRLALEAVLDGTADVTSIYAARKDEAAVRTALAEHVGDREVQLRPLAFTAWSPSDVVVVNRNLPRELAARLALAFIDLCREGAADPALRELLQARSLTVASPSMAALVADARADAAPAEAAGRDVAFELTQDGRIARISGPAALSVEALTGSDAAPGVRDLARRVIASATPEQLEFRREHAGEIQWWTAEASPWGEGAERNALIVLRNTTTQRQAEQELLRMASFPVLDPSPVIELDSEGAVGFANPAARNLFPDLLELGPRHPLAIAAVAAQRAHQGAASPAQFEYTHGERQLEIGVSRIEELRTLRVFTMDVSERKRMEATLIKTDRLVALGTLCAGVGHEINNPLAYIVANLTFMSEELHHLRHEEGGTRLTEELIAVLEETQLGTERIAAIVRDLKVLSRDADEQRVALDIRAVLETALRMAASHLRNRVTVVRELSAVPLVEASETRLGQVFLNLVMNAAQAMGSSDPSRNQLKLVTRTDAAGHVVVELSDTGSGIPPEVGARIFEPFFTTKPVGVGTGLGLSISNAIVTGLGGVLSFESRVGVGTTFRVQLPPSAKTVAPSSQADAPRSAEARRQPVRAA